jgi:hypothetical protein
MRARNTFVRGALPRHRRSAFTERRLGPPTTPSAATDGVPERARQHSPTSAIDAKPEHTGERSLPGALPLFTAKRCASRRSGGAKPHRPFGPGVSAAQARKPALVPDLDIPVTGAGPDNLEGDGVFRGQPRLTSGTPRERTIPWKRARMPFAARDPSGSIRPGLAALGELTPALPAPLFTWEGGANR